MSDIKRQIIGFGGGGLDPKNPLLDLYVLAQTGKTLPKICLLPTASGDNMGLIKHFYSLFDRYPCEPSHFSVFNPHTSNLRDYFLSQDVILVSGGHSKSMMILWKGYGIDTILREAYEQGTVLAGGSAGSVCWFDQCVTDSVPGTLSVMDCLGFLPHSNCPHFGSEERQAAYSYYIRHNEIKPGFAADDAAGLHFVNGELLRCVSSDKTDRCYHLYMNDKTFIKKRLKTHFLGDKENQEQFILNAPCFGYLKEQAAEEHETEETVDNALPPKSDTSTPVAE